MGQVHGQGSVDKYGGATANAAKTANTQGKVGLLLLLGPICWQWLCSA